MGVSEPYDIVWVTVDGVTGELISRRADQAVYFGISQPSKDFNLEWIVGLCIAVLAGVTLFLFLHFRRKRRVVTPK